MLRRLVFCIPTFKTHAFTFTNSLIEQSLSQTVIKYFLCERQYIYTTIRAYCVQNTIPISLNGTFHLENDCIYYD